MRTTKLDTSGVFQTSPSQGQKTRLTLPPGEFSVSQNGIEFHSEHSAPLWTEMSVDLIAPLDGKRIHCTGVVVECHGNRHAGYFVSLIFMRLSRQSQQRLTQLVSARPA